MEDKREADYGLLYTLRLCFDGRDPRQLRLAALVHAVDVWSQVELVDIFATEDAAELAPVQLHLVTRDGKVLAGYDLFTCLVRSLRLLWLVALATWIPGVAGFGQSLYPGDTTGLPVQRIVPPVPLVGKASTPATSEHIQRKNGTRG